MNIQTNDLSKYQSQIAYQLKETTDYNSLSIDDKFRVNEQVLVNIGQVSSRINSFILPLLWECWIQGNWGENPVHAYREWVQEIIAPAYPDETQNYIQTLAVSVCGVLAIAHNHEASGQPILDEKNEPVTVKRLLAAPSKVKEFGWFISNQENPEEWIAHLPTKRREDLSTMRSNGKPAMPKVHAEILEHEEGGFTVTLHVPDNAALRLIERLLKFVQFPLPKGA